MKLKPCIKNLFITCMLFIILIYIPLNLLIGLFGGYESPGGALKTSIRSIQLNMLHILYETYMNDDIKNIETIKEEIIKTTKGMNSYQFKFINNKLAISYRRSILEVLFIEKPYYVIDYYVSPKGRIVIYTSIPIINKNKGDNIMVTYSEKYPQTKDFFEPGNNYIHRGEYMKPDELSVLITRFSEEDKIPEES